MNKNELIDALAPRLGGRAAAALAVESVVDAVLRQVAAGGSVAITGFGTFEPVDRAPRTGRNPHTGDPVPIPAARVPRFRPGSYFRAVVAEPSELPVEGLAGARVGSSDDDATGEEDGATAEQGASPSGAPGVPSSIRRPAGARSVGPRPDARRSGRPSERSTGGAGRRRPGGSPTTVRADRTRPAPAPSAGPAGQASPGGRLTIGGEQITREVISAKKAQLARVKSDEAADRAGRAGQGGSATGTGGDGSGKGRGQGKKGKKKGKKKGGRKKDKAAKGKKGSGDS